MEAASIRARLRGFSLSPARFRTIAIASAVALYVIVVSGATVRLTASGLGCESWPGCRAGAFFPADDHHAFVEFGNRTVALFPITLSLLAWVAAARTPGVDRWTAWTAAATFVGTVGQAPLGFITIVADLHPLLVLSHFVLALLVLAGGVVVSLEAWRLERGGLPAVALPGRLRAGAVLATVACFGLVLSGTLATAAGPHSGGADIRRMGNLVDAVRLHVRVTAAFGLLFAGLLVWVWLRRKEWPGLWAASLAVLGLLLAQMAVGEIQWRTQLPWGVVLVHVALATAVWAGVVALATLVLRPHRWLQGERGRVHWTDG
jgi:cytochrome c oxidase assembly protein subunit 15